LHFFQHRIYLFLKEVIIMNRIIILIALYMSFLFFFSCSSPAPTTEKLRVIVTNFPLYDFTRNVAGDNALVTILIPPGVEPHAYEPKPQDIIDLNNADIFIFTGEAMEPWVPGIIASLTNKKLIVVDASKGIRLYDTHVDDAHTAMTASDDDDHGHGVDPHIWLDPVLAQTMTDTITAALSQADPEHKTVYESNGTQYKQHLSDLDNRCKDIFSRVTSRTIIYGGHFAFGYFAHRYTLNVVSPYEGFAPDAEPSAKKIAALIDTIKQTNSSVIFHEELIEPRIAAMLSQETGAQLMILHGAHNLSKKELEDGVTYLSLMNQNLENLKKALNYR